jgi:hypothetical protein
MDFKVKHSYKFLNLWLLENKYKTKNMIGNALQKTKNMIGNALQTVFLKNLIFFN